ncbi:MAG: polymerase alpha subunit, partial [Acidimicrobiales bacterium]|nr:polymerase alpha subunit [Acidimicrobiales bacterium]
IKARAAVQDAARVLGHPFQVGLRVSKAMPPLVMGRDTPLFACLEPHPKYEDGYKMAADLRTMYATEPDVKQIVDVAKGLEGLRRQDGIHAAAVVITRDPLTEYLPIQRKPAPGGGGPASGAAGENGAPVEEAPIVTQYEMHGVEDLGLLKMDFLGLRNLDVMDMTVTLIRETLGEALDIDAIPLDDDLTLSMLRRGESIGVFQLEGGPMRALMRSLAPTSFDDVAALVALYRPGPMAQNWHNEYADRKNGRTPVVYFHADAEEILHDTYGLVIYQEGLMRVAAKFAGYSLEAADNLRKACLPAGSLMLTKERGYVPLERVMALRDRRVQTIDQTSATSRFEAVDDVWSVGSKPVYRLTTSTGYSIEATGNHPFLVEDEWRRLSDIKSGDLVGVAARTATEGNSHISDAEIDLAALLISEGYTPELRNGFHANGHFTNADPDLISVFRSAFAVHFGYAATRESTNERRVTQIRLTKAELLSLEGVLGSFGLAGDKSIPLRIINAPRRKVERFLGLYFCADGWADASGVHYGSKSRAVCLALKRMLLRCGLTSNLYSREIPGHGTHWTLSVADKSMAKQFAFVVEPHLTPRKSAKAARHLYEWGSGWSATNIGIPSSFLAAELERRVSVTGKSKRQLGVSSVGYTNCRVLHRYTLDMLLFSERLEDLRTGDLIWDTVVSVEYVGEKECFDFRMANPGRPYALVDDFLVHNCGKKDRVLIKKEREQFVDGCERTGYGKELGKQLFDMIEPFADYAFNKSHSYGYGFVAYQTAYLKAHYPVQYLAALLTSVKGDKDKTAVYLAECRALGIQVLVPDVNVSGSDFTALDRTIPFGLSAIRNVGEGLVAQLLVEREANGPFADFYDFCDRVDPQVLNKRTIESLIKAGGFDSMGHPRKGLLLVFEQIVDRVLDRRRKEAEGQFDLFGSMADPADTVPVDRIDIPDVEFDKTLRLSSEKEMLGLYVSDHPLMGAEGALRRASDCSIAEFREMKDGDCRWVGGVVTSLQRKYTKRGDLMAVFVLEDLQAAIEVMVFPKTMMEVGPMLSDDAVICVKGRLDLREEPAKIMALEVKPVALPAEGDIGAAVELKLPPYPPATVIASLKQCVLEHPGDRDVILHVGPHRIRLSDRYRVSIGNGFCGELRTLEGPIELLT